MDDEAQLLTNSFLAKIQTVNIPNTEWRRRGKKTWSSYCSEFLDSAAVKGRLARPDGRSVRLLVRRHCRMTEGAEMYKNVVVFVQWKELRRGYLFQSRCRKKGVADSSPYIKGSGLNRTLLCTDAYRPQIHLNVILPSPRSYKRCPHENCVCISF
jgi:hypothetical protein